MSILAVVLTFAAMVCFALSTPAHFTTVCGRVLATRAAMALRAAGAALLAISFVICVRVWGSSVGIVAGLGLAAAAVPSVAMALTYLPRLRDKIGTR